MKNDTNDNRYGNIRKILLPISYSIIIIALIIIIYIVIIENDLTNNNQDLLDFDESSIEPLKSKEALTKGNNYEELELTVDSELLIKGLSYFNVAQKEDEENKNIYYLKSIRVLTEAITEAIYKDNINELNSILFYHLAYSYLLFGEEYFAISLNYFNHAEKLNNEDKLLMKGKREGKIYLLELFEISGSVYFQLGQYKNTIEYFDKAKTLNSDNILYDLVLAKSYYEIGEYEKSYEYYNFVLNNYDKEKTYKNEIINDEIIEQIKLHIPRLQYLMKNYHSAISYYKKYIKEYGDSAELRYIIGKIYETLSFIENNKQKQKEYINKAIEQWKKSIIIKPDYGRSMLKLWRYNAQI